MTLALLTAAFLTVASAALASGTSPGAYSVRFVSPQHAPPADLPLAARHAGTAPEGTSTSGAISFRVVTDLRDHGPLGRVLGPRLNVVDVTWWDRGLFRAESAVDAFLRRLVASGNGATNTFVPWAQLLPVPSVAGAVEETGGRRGHLLVWYSWPSVYSAYRDGDGAWWFSHWINVDELRLETSR